MYIVIISRYIIHVRVSLTFFSRYDMDRFGVVFRASPVSILKLLFLLSYNNACNNFMAIHVGMIIAIKCSCQNKMLFS